ncbi:thiol:disulfide interchange protein DsbA [soil metagenome]
MLKRRDFSAVLAVSALSGPPGLASAQVGAPVEGKQFIRLGQTLPTAPAKIEVVEFFWYGCPHCFVFDPVLEAWVKGLPADVSFRRIHVGFNAMIKLHQKLFFALEAMGKEAEVHTAIFNAFHRERLELNDEDAIVALVGKLGVDRAKFKDAFNSFGVQSKCLQASKLSENFRIDGVPALGVGGKFWTSPSMAGTRGQAEIVLGQQAVAVADHLIKLVRAKA